MTMSYPVKKHSCNIAQNPVAMLNNSHKALLFTALCVSFISYSAYIYNDITTQAEKPDRLADEGKKVWQEKNCIACHQIYQLGGYLGPDLTNTFSEKGPEYIKVFIQNGTAVMPSFDLTARETEALLAYMKQIDASGSADPRTFSVSPNGMTFQKQPHDNK